MVEQMNRDLIDKYTTEYRQIFDILLDKNNYPVVIHCSSGKRRRYRHRFCFGARRIGHK